MLPKTKTGGFTLIEILVVIAIIAVLAAITIVALNPAQNLQEARDTERSSSVNQILSAISQWIVDGGAVSSLGLTACSSGVDNIGTSTGNIDLGTQLVPTYMVGIPTDPNGGTDADTGYDICEEGTGRITITAPNAETGAISVSR